MGNLFYHSESKTLHHIGGANSRGVNFTLKMGEKNWQESSHSHSMVANTKEMELLNNTCTYFV